MDPMHPDDGGSGDVRPKPTPHFLVLKDPAARLLVCCLLQVFPHSKLLLMILNRRRWVYPTLDFSTSP